MKLRITYLLIMSMALCIRGLCQTHEFRFEYLGGPTPPCNPFKDEPNNFAEAWKVSHGTPSVVEEVDNDFFVNGELKASLSSVDNTELSEGLFVDYAFQPTHAYSFEIYVKQGAGGSVGLDIYAAKSVAEKSNTDCKEEEMPTVSSKRAIYQTRNVPSFPTGNFNPVYVDNWRPKFGFSQLWISSRNFGIGTSGALKIQSIFIVDEGDIPDTQPPTIPGPLNVSALTTSGFKISWTPSTDDIDLVGYKIFKNGSLVSTTEATSFTFTGMSNCSFADIEVVAYDSHDNQSPPSQATITTKEVSNAQDVFNLSADISSQTSVTFIAGSAVNLTTGFIYVATAGTTGFDAKLINPNCGVVHVGGGRKNTSVLITKGTTQHSESREANNEINIFPNPATSTLHVDSNSSPYRVIILSQNGTLVQSFEQLSGESELDISFLKTDLYFVRIVSATGNRTYKLAKQ